MDMKTFRNTFRIPSVNVHHFVIDDEHNITLHVEIKTYHRAYSFLYYPWPSLYACAYLRGYGMGARAPLGLSNKNKLRKVCTKMHQNSTKIA